MKCYILQPNGFDQVIKGLQFVRITLGSIYFNHTESLKLLKKPDHPNFV